MSQQFRVNSSNDFIEIDRHEKVDNVEIPAHTILDKEVTVFSVKQSIGLIGFTCSEVFSQSNEDEMIRLSVTISIEQNGSRIRNFDEIELTSKEESSVLIEPPIQLTPNTPYRIVISQNGLGQYFNRMQFPAIEFNLGNGNEIHFQSDSETAEIQRWGLLRRLKFMTV